MITQMVGYYKKITCEQWHFGGHLLHLLSFFATGVRGVTQQLLYIFIPLFKLMEDSLQNRAEGIYSNR